VALFKAVEGICRGVGWRCHESQRNGGLARRRHNLNRGGAIGESRGGLTGGPGVTVLVGRVKSKSKWFKHFEFKI
jgi:hypothetical protein